MNSKLLLVTLGCLLLFSCDDSSKSNSTKELLALIEVNQKKWEAANIDTYTFTYYSPPNDCPTVDPRPAVEITVENEVVSKLYVIDFDSFLDVGSSSFPTIDNVFHKMINSVEHIKGTPLFDDTFGFPIEYETDVSSQECDGYSVYISSFI